MNGLTDREKAVFQRHKGHLPPALVAMIEKHDKAWNRGLKGGAEAWFQVNVGAEMPAVAMHVAIAAREAGNVGVDKLILSIG